MKILICGATGFMGRNLFEYFSKDPNNQVYGTSFSKEKYHENIYKVNLKNEGEVNVLFNMIHPDVVIQAAAITTGVKDEKERPYIHVTDNVIINSLVLREAFLSKVKHFLFLSCGVMYPPSEIPLKESDWKETDKIADVYFGGAWMKIYTEKACEFYSMHGMKCTAIRHSNTYGPYDKNDPDRSHVLAGTVRKVMHANDTVSIWGSGKEGRDFVYVTDVINAVQLLINKQVQPFELVNVSAGYALTINELVDKVIQYSGKKLSITHDTSKPTVPITLCFDHSYIENKYGWTPLVNIDAGLKMTLEWYKKHYMEENNEFKK